MGKTDGTKDPPFKVDRAKSESLMGQLVDGFRQAILSGYYAPGDLLPSIRKISKLFSVSLIVPRDAIERLRFEGFIVSRPGIGSVVVPRDVKVWQGHVQLVIPDVSGSYYANVFGDRLKCVLSEAGYSFTRMTVAPQGRGYDFSSMDLELNRNVDMTVLMGNNAQIERHLSEKKAPFLVVGQDLCERKFCVGSISRHRDSAVDDFVTHCQSRGIRSVWQVGRTRGYVDAVSKLLRVGIKAREIVVPADASFPRPRGTMQGAINYFERLLSKGVSLPDLIFFTDDYVATGALMSILGHGVRIPDDVAVVTWAHYGSGPCAPFSLTRMEMDAAAHGGAVAAALVAYLRGGRLDTSLLLCPRYIVGESFP